MQMHLLIGLLLRELLVRLGRRGGVRSPVPFELVHATRGRLRVRLRERVGLDQLAATLREIGGVRDVASNARSGSIVIQFDEREAGVRERIIAALGAGVVLPAAGAVPSGLAPGQVPEMRQRVHDLFGRADTRLFALSRGAVDLQTLLGLAVASYGAKTVILPGRLPRWNGLVMLHWGYGLLRAKA